MIEEYLRNRKLWIVAIILSYFPLLPYFIDSFGSIVEFALFWFFLIGFISNGFLNIIGITNFPVTFLLSGIWYMGMIIFLIKAKELPRNQLYRLSALVLLTLILNLIGLYIASQTKMVPFPQTVPY